VYRDKKVVGVFVLRFRAPLQYRPFSTDDPEIQIWGGVAQGGINPK
jgi:hypothetical protein